MDARQREIKATMMLQRARKGNVWNVQTGRHCVLIDCFGNQICIWGFAGPAQTVPETRTPEFSPGIGLSVSQQMVCKNS